MGALLVFVLAAICAGTVVWVLERQELSQQRTQVADMAGDHVQALQRAIYIYNVDRESWRIIQRNGMQADFSWARSAVGYQQLYEWALARVRGR